MLAGDKHLRFYAKTYSSQWIAVYCVWVESIDGHNIR